MINTIKIEGYTQDGSLAEYPVTRISGAHEEAWCEQTGDDHDGFTEALGTTSSPVSLLDAYNNGYDAAKTNDWDL